MTERVSQLPEGMQFTAEDEEDIYTRALANERAEKYGFRRGFGPVVRQSSGRESSSQCYVENLSN